MPRKMAFVGAVVAAAVAAFVIVLSQLDRLAKRPGGTNAAVVTSCEIELGPERCAANLDFAPGRARVFFDAFDGADVDENRCMRRALDYFGACKSRSPVTARFYRGRELIRSTTHK
ncbi:MAG: hypothetical protein AB7F78_16455 [Hyphomicrobiaceae bacterium]